MDLTMEGRKGIKRQTISPKIKCEFESAKEEIEEYNGNLGSLEFPQSTTTTTASTVPMNSERKYSRKRKVLSLNDQVRELKNYKMMETKTGLMANILPESLALPIPIPTTDFTAPVKCIKRNAIDLNDKYEIIRELENGKTQTQVRKNWNLPQSTVATIWKRREQIKVAFDFKDGNVKKLKVPHHSSLEEKLLSWVELMNSRQIQLIGPLIQLKAKEIAEEEGILTFSASNGWLQKFKARHGIVFSAMNGGASMKWRSLSAQQSASLQRLAETEPESVIIECEPMPTE